MKSVDPPVVAWSCENSSITCFRKRRKVSYESWNDGGLTSLERAAGLWRIINGRENGECSCGECDECEGRCNTKLERRKSKLENSSRFKEAAKSVAGLRGNREVKFALTQKVHQESLESAVVRYMANEALPEYYTAILKSPTCIDRLVAGIFCKVCKIKNSQELTEQISKLSSSLRSNLGRLTAYDRVTLIQQFIHRIVDQYIGVGAGLLIPVAPMKNALSAARLHLSIFDVIEHGREYVTYIDNLSTASLRLEYKEPRLSTAPSAKQSFPRWRVRHLRPLSYYFPEQRRVLLRSLRDLDENIPSYQFVSEALLLYAEE